MVAEPSAYPFAMMIVFKGRGPACPTEEAPVGPASPGQETPSGAA